MDDTAKVPSYSIVLYLIRTLLYSTYKFVIWQVGWIESVSGVTHHFFKDLTPKEKRKKAMKLHRQFSHTSKEKLYKLVKGSKDFNDAEFLKIIWKYCVPCKVCMRYKYVPLCPVVALLMADKFNQIVCMDLKEYIHNKTWILHIIDSAPRYSATCLVFSKQ